MATTAHKTAPRFYQGQQVHFIGGSGKVKSLRPDAGGWLYQVEMEMGPLPTMGRIGYETTVVLSEVDMAGADDRLMDRWAVA